MDYKELLDLAKGYIENELKPGTVFEVKQLFGGVKWEALEKGDRIGFGRYFSNAVNNGVVKNITMIERAKNNHARYKKIGDDNK